MTLFYIILATIALGLVSFSGAVVMLWKRLNTENALAHFVSFAAGIMLVVAFIDLLPEALEEAGDGGGNILVFTLVGILLFFFLERFVVWFHHHDETHGEKPPALLVLIGDAVHNFIDGIAIAAAFLTNPVLGVATTVAIAAHEIPQEIADFSVLLYGGMKRKRALLFNFLSALTALVGGVVGYYFLERVAGLLPIFLAFSAGMFIYIACSDLIPDLHREFKRERRWLHVLPFIFGIAIFWVLRSLLE
ncbi:MAG TPA: ZIP family metal transporter [Patescibacteria group bacterium]|nr:ZIP family metal transporter [Patescibacteria group bacterium]